MHKEPNTSAFQEASPKEIKSMLKDKSVMHAICQFLQCSQKMLLEAIQLRGLETTQAQVTLSGISQERKLYSGYTQVVIPKSDGKTFRTLSIPADTIKHVQSQILGALGDVNMSRAVQGGEPGTSAVKNATMHLANPYLYTTDIESAYPSVTPARVYKNLSGALSKIFAFTYPHLTKEQRQSFCHIIVFLVCYHNQLPQGAPTSSRLLNMVFAQTDAQIYKYLYDENSNLANPLYTRYIDDIAVSFKGFISHIKVQKTIKNIQKEILILLSPDGETPHWERTKEIGVSVKALYDLSEKIEESTKDVMSKHGKEKIIRLLQEIMVHSNPLLQHEKNEISSAAEVLIKERVQPFLMLLQEKQDFTGMDIVKHEIRSIIIKNGWRIKDTKEKIWEPGSSTVREITGVMIGHDGRLGIKREKMNEYIDFVQVCAHYPSKLHKKFLDPVSGIPDPLKLCYTLNGIRNFIQDVKGHIPDKFETPYQFVKAKYFSQIKNMPNSYSYSHVNGAELQ